MKIHIYVYNKCNPNIYQLLINRKLLLQKKKYLNYLPKTINYFGTK